MALTPLVAMVRKDLQLFFSDRRAVIMSFLVPIAIASFFGSIFSGPSRNSEPVRVSIAMIDEDGSSISNDIVAGAGADSNLKVTLPTADEARAAVRRGTDNRRRHYSARVWRRLGRSILGQQRETAARSPLRPLARDRVGHSARHSHRARHAVGE